MPTPPSIIPFLIRIPVFDDESLPSVYVRVAQANYYSSVDSVLEVVAQTMRHTIRHATMSSILLWNPLSQGGDQPNEAVHFHLLATLFRISADRLRAMCLPSFMLDDLIRPPVIQLCPECVMAQPYHRKHWLSFVVAACPIHRRLLLDQCPACAKKLQLHALTTLRCHACAYDLTADPAIPLEDDDARLMGHHRIIQRMLDMHDEGVEDATAFEVQRAALQYQVFRWLRQLILSAPPRWMYRDRRVVGLNGRTRWPQFPTCTVAQRYAVVSTAMDALLRWPTSFAAFLIHYHTAARTQFGLSLIDEAIHSSRFRHPQYTFVWDAFEPLLAERFYPVQQCIYTDEHALDRPFGYISMEKAAEVLDTVSDVVDHLVYLGVLNGERPTYIKRGFVKAADVRALRTSLNTFISCTEAARWLGCSMTLVLALVARKLLVGAAVAENEDHTSWEIQPVSVIQLLTILVQRGVEWTSEESPQLEQLERAVRKLTTRGMEVEVIDLVHAVVDGRLMYYRERMLGATRPWYVWSTDVPLGIPALIIDEHELWVCIVSLMEGSGSERTRITN